MHLNPQGNRIHWDRSQSNDPDDYYVDLDTSSSFSKHFNICIITLGQITGTTFPVNINSQVNINALYDTGAV